MNEINEKLVEACGVTQVIDEKHGNHWIHQDAGIVDGEFDYKDPRCREIIREHFKIETRSSGSYGLWFSWCPAKGGWHDIHKWEDTIEQAECACIKAIAGEL